jgi:hypothetical protein
MDPEATGETRTVEEDEPMQPMQDPEATMDALNADSQDTTHETKALHECTCELPGSVPTGFPNMEC